MCKRFAAKLLLNPADKPPGEVDEFGSDTPMQRPAQPEEIAPAFVYFASEADSSYVTGEVLTLLGGETAAVGLVCFRPAVPSASTSPFQFAEIEFT